MSEAERHLDHYFSGAATNSEYARSWREVKAELDRLMAENSAAIETIKFQREVIEAAWAAIQELKTQVA